MAVALKVPVKKIEALEADRFDQLPDTVFVRSLAMSICRTLKMQPDQVLALLPAREQKGLKPVEGGVNANFRETSLDAQSSWRHQLLSPGRMGVLILLAIATLILVWRAPADEEPLTNPVVRVAPGAALANLSQPTAAVTPSADKSPSAEPLPSVASTISMGAIQASEVPPQLLSKSPDGVSAHVLQLNARGVSWVEVSDADGIAQVRKLTAAGEELRVSGKLPLSVVLGRADQLDAVVRGHAFDLKSVARDNVARFEVK